MERGVEWDFEPTLDRIAALVDLLGSPQRAYPVVHIAGTNGKTSTARLTEALLKERNLRVGRFTSPHLVSMRERITVDGEPLSEERFAEVYEEIAPYVEMVDTQGRRIQFFELLTAMAFAAFADTPIDVAVVEAGMGGSWDATNVADGTVAVITPISLDHTDWLGPDIPSIAGGEGGHHQGRQHRGAGAAAAARRRGADAAGGRDEGAVVAREGLEFGVLSREVALGGQLLTLRGLEGRLRRGLPAALRHPSGEQRRVRAGRGGGADRRRRSAGRGAGAAGVRPGDLAGPAGGRPP